MRKMLNKKGFTLAELLIVVAIIAVLVAIAIPVFTTQLEKSKEETDAANVRSAVATLTTKYLTENAADSVTIEAKQSVAGWQGEQPKINQMIDGTMSEIAYDASTTSYTVAVSASGNITITAA